MARTPPAKRRGTPVAPPDPHVMSLRLPPDLVIEIDAIAAKERRSRAKQIEVVLRQFVQSYGKRAAA